MCAVLDKRNGLPLAAPGDKSYQAVEYSPAYFNADFNSLYALRSA